MTIKTVFSFALLSSALGLLSAPSYALSPASPQVVRQSSSIILAAASDKTIKGAEVFISAVAERGISFLDGEELSQEQREKEFKKLLSDSFDMETIGRFALGRYWRTASPAQQKEYLKLFKQMVVEVYASRFSEYGGQKLEIKSARAEGKSDVLVTSIIKGGEPEVRLDWRVRYKNGRYKVIDVVVAGVSMALTQRSDFSSVIQRGGGSVDVLLAELKK